MDVMESAAGNEGSAASGLMGAGMGLGMGVGMGGAFGAGFSNLANQTMGSVGSHGRNGFRVRRCAKRSRVSQLRKR